MEMNDTVLTEIEESVLCWLATVDADLAPSVTPKEIFATYGRGHILIADIASSNSVANIKSNPKVCVGFVDIFRQRGFKLTGTASIFHRESPEFETFAKTLLSMAGADVPIRNVILVEISKIARFWAPSYRLSPQRTDEERMADAYKTYGVKPL